MNAFWFRKDLRIEDNKGLSKALHSSEKCLVFYIVDSEEWDTMGEKSKAYLQDALYTLYQNLGGKLLVLQGKTLDLLPRIIEQYSIKHLFFNQDYTPQAIAQENFLKNYGKIACTFCKDRVIFDKNEVLKSDGTPYTVYTPYAKKWKLQYPEPVTYLAHLENLSTEIFDWPWDRKEKLKTPQINPELLKNYATTRNFPELDATSRLGVALRFGTISVRTCVKAAMEYSEIWLNELIWREFFIQILAHFPRVVHQSFRTRYDTIAWRNNEDDFAKWCKGETGYELVDAGMKQLNQTGFMHNRVRMVVASFLTKHLLVDWRWGEAYFAQHLLDYELASNNGNWQWAAGCGCDAAPYFRVFNPLEQQKKFDKNRLYIRRWLGNRAPIEPIVEHAFARQRALGVYSKALLQ